MITPETSAYLCRTEVFAAISGARLRLPAWDSLRAFKLALQNQSLK
jgi:hypothetical protein